MSTLPYMIPCTVPRTRYTSYSHALW